MKHVIVPVILIVAMVMWFISAIVERLVDFLWTFNKPKYGTETYCIEKILISLSAWCFRQCPWLRS